MLLCAVQTRSELIRLHPGSAGGDDDRLRHPRPGLTQRRPRVAVLKDGLLLQVDSANDLYAYCLLGEFDLGSPKLKIVDGALNVFRGAVSVDVLGVRADITAPCHGGWPMVCRAARSWWNPAPRPAPANRAWPTRAPASLPRADVSVQDRTEVFAELGRGEVRVVARLPRAPIPEPGEQDRARLRREQHPSLRPGVQAQPVGRHRQC